MPRLHDEDRLKGNQVKILNDPVTVTEERPSIVHCTDMYEKERNRKDPEARKPA